METFSALLVFVRGNSPVTGEFPARRPMTRGFDIFFNLCLNKRLSKQSWGWWFETPSGSLWCHFNVLIFFGLLWTFMSTQRGLWFKRPFPRTESSAKPSCSWLKHITNGELDCGEVVSKWPGPCESDYRIPEWFGFARYDTWQVLDVNNSIATRKWYEYVAIRNWCWILDKAMTLFSPITIQETTGGSKISVIYI